jgi:hypothetical protein
MTMKMVMVEGEEGEEDLVDLMDSEGMMMMMNQVDLVRLIEMKGEVEVEVVSVEGEEEVALGAETDLMIKIMPMVLVKKVNRLKSQ